MAAETVWRDRVAVTAPSSQKLQDGVGELTFLSDISHSTHTARPPIGHHSRNTPQTKQDQGIWRDICGSTATTWVRRKLASVRLASEPVRESNLGRRG